MRAVSFGLLLGFFSLNCFASDIYRGLIYGTVIEENGHVYMGSRGIGESGDFDGKQIVYFYQERGQQVGLSKSNIVIDSSNQHKYHLTFNILERVSDKFKADVSFYLNTMQSINNKQVLVSKIIKTEQIEGQLNAENQYVFINDAKPNLKLTLNIDREFSKQEILKKLQQKMSDH